VDKAIIRQYRQLLSADFPNSGAIENPSIFVEAIGERMIHCGNTGNYMQLYINIANDRIADIRYLCSCEPTANVAVEVMCNLVKGKTLDEALTIPEQAFSDALDCRGEEYRVKARGLMEMLNEGISGYRKRQSA
jgi:NifU-like protein involved in Fe-S cluster formation